MNNPNGQTERIEQLADIFLVQFRSLKASMNLFSSSMSQPLSCSDVKFVDVRYASFAPDNQLEALSTAYSQLIFEEQKSTGKNQLFGLASVSHDLITLANLINDKKTAIYETVMKMRSAVGLGNRGAGQMFRRDPYLNSFFQSAGLARIDLRLVYRHIPIAPRNTTKIAFSWTKNSRKTLKLTHDQCLAMVIESKGCSDIYELLAKRLALVGGQYVAYSTPIAPTLVANISAEMGEGMVKNKLIRAPLPILCDSMAPLPSVRWPGQIDRQKNSRKRSDARISDVPIVHGLKFYPYLSQ